MRYLDQLVDDQVIAAPLAAQTRIGVENVPLPSRANEQTAEDPAVVARAAAMRERHPHPWAAIPFLTVRDVPRGTRGCRSCGEPIDRTGVGLMVRCRSCTQAVERVLLEGPCAYQSERGSGTRQRYIVETNKDCEAMR